MDPSTRSRSAAERPFPPWDAAYANTLDEPGLLLYRSNLLGSDLRITNYGGGNTSAKLRRRDPLTGDMVEVLWVKGSGGDLGSMKLDGFATLYLDKLHALQKMYRGPGYEDGMVAYLPHCTFNLNPRAASIDTPLHAFLPFPHVDHMHPDAIIAIAAMKDGQRVTSEIFGDDVGWVPWRRPGFELGLVLSRYQREHPRCKGLILESHGLFTWGETSHECYENTVGVIGRAEQWLRRLEVESRAPAFGGKRRDALSAQRQDAVLASLLPVLRGLASTAAVPKLLHVDRQDVVVEFVNSQWLHRLAQVGTSCPDHFLRTKIRPLVLDEDLYELPESDLRTRLAAALEAYRTDYSAYYERCKRADSPAMRDSNPVVVLLPGIGMVTMAKDKTVARLAGEFYVNAINVMRAAGLASEYVGLPEQEAFDIEYWHLEEAKLRREPAARPLVGKVVLITGGAGGIGQAIARRVLREGGSVVLADIDQDSLTAVGNQLATEFGRDRVRQCRCDVTSEASIQAAARHTVMEYGGLDSIVCNAGIASAAPLEDTTLELWNRNQLILATGYFLSAREAFRIMKQQRMGGAMVMVGSKNGLVASQQATAYCAAKAAEIQLSRSVALEGAPLGIRSNVVNPDAVIRGSKIWGGQWSQERAAANKVSEDELEDFYRQRSMLKRSVLPEDIAEAAYFFIDERLSGKSTGNIVNVDAGNIASFTR